MQEADYLLGALKLMQLLYFGLKIEHAKYMKSVAMLTINNEFKTKVVHMERVSPELVTNECS